MKLSNKQRIAKAAEDVNNYMNVDTASNKWGVSEADINKNIKYWSSNGGIDKQQEKYDLSY